MRILSESSHKIYGKLIGAAIIVCLLLCVIETKAGDVKLVSPNKNISVDISLLGKIYYSVYFKGERILEASPLTLTIGDAMLGANPKMINGKPTTVNENIETVYGSRKLIHDNYNQLTLDFEGDFSVEFRAYDNGVAYRFVTRLKDKTVTVKHEEVSFRFNFGVTAWMLDAKTYETNFKKTSLDVEKITSFNNSKNKIHLPLFIQPIPNVKVAITEADLHEYPSLFLDRGNDYENFLNGVFEKYTLTTKTGGFSNYSQLADKEADYIAITEGTRDYPWRLMVISDDDKTFADCDLVYQLSKPCALKEISWIKPGKVAWEWWHDYAVEGKDFKGGVNTNTYLYQIDFASKFGIEYILIDWMWTDKNDLRLFSPEVDIKRIIVYATEKKVKVIVWCPGHSLHQQLKPSLDLFASLGIAGVKADFFGREDQTGIRMYEDIAKATAEHKMLIDFHGCTKPTGLSRTYPNIINYEAVAGNEYNKLSDKCTIEHKVMLPFTRGLQGPMDFTPGGMRNMQNGHNIRFTLPEVHGTRCNEMATYVLYNEPLKMLCDAPSVYEREPAITSFISKIPTVWDDTKILLASFGEYIVTARKTGATWYVAGMAGENAKEVIIDFSFLGKGNFTAQILKDGPNAEKIGTDYLFENKQIDRLSKLTMPMVQGGGFIICIK